MFIVLTALHLHSRSVQNLAAMRAGFGLNSFYTRRLVGRFVASSALRDLFSGRRVRSKATPHRPFSFQAFSSGVRAFRA
jgi:hypothetical protein